VFNNATGLVEETYDVEFDESNNSQGAHENCDDVGNEPLREAMKNMPIGDVKPKEEDDYEVQVINQPSSSSTVPQVGSDEQACQDAVDDSPLPHEDTHVSQYQIEAQAQDVDAPQAPQVVEPRRHNPRIQAHPQDLIIRSPSRGIMTGSK
jgi:hypothetical protein